MKKSTIILLIFLILVVILILVLQILSGKQSNNTGAKQAASEISSNQTLKVSSSTNISQLLGVTEAVIVTFSKPTSTFLYSVSPEEENNLVSGIDSLSLRVEPKQAWRFNTEYSLTIKQGTVSIDGSRLNENYFVKFKTKPYSGI